MKTTKLPLVFLVENHEDTLESIKSFLELQGYKVISARDIKTALQFAKSEKFDILVSDISLPDGDGWSLLKQISQKHPVRAIAMSGFGMKADLAKSKAAGFVEHLIKPFQGESLEAAIQRAVPEFYTPSAGQGVTKQKEKTRS